MHKKLWQWSQSVSCYLNRKSILFHFFIGLMSFLSAQVSLAQKNCHEVFQKETSSLNLTSAGLASAQEDLQRDQEKLKSRLDVSQGSKTLTYRGFLGADFSNSQEFADWASQQGYLYWGVRIYFAESFAQAAAHDRSVQDFNLKGLYLIASEKLSEDFTQEQALDYFKRNSQGLAVMNTGGSFDSHGKFQEGVMTFVPQSVLKNILDVSKMKFSKTVEGPMFAQVGWTYPLFPAIIDLGKDWTSSSTIKRNRADLRKLLRQGYRFTVNQHFPQAMEELKKQERHGSDASTNRFLNPALVQKYVQAFDQGKLLSLELVNPQGQLAAGTFIPRAPGILYPESPYYQHINLAKAVFTFLGDQMLKKGLPWMYIGSTTAFTRDLKGDYGTREQFQNLLSTYREIELNSEDFQIQGDLEP